MVLLVVSVTIPRFVFPVAGVNANAERAVGPLVALGVVAAALARGQVGRLSARQLSNLRAFNSLPVLGLAVFILANGLGALLNAPRRGDSLRLTLLIALVSLPFWLVPALTRTPRLGRFAGQAFVAAGLAEAGLGLGLLALFQLARQNWGLQNALFGVYQTDSAQPGLRLETLTWLMAPYATQWEGNTFGSFVAAALVLLLGWGLPTRRGRRQSVLLAVGVAILAVALAVSLARGAWLGAAAGLAVVFICGGFRRGRLLLGAGLTAGGGVAALYLLGFGGIVERLAQRVGYLAGIWQGPTDISTIERLHTFNLAWQGWLQQPLIGWGAGSFGQLYTYATNDNPAWIGNLELHALHDGGLLGLLGLALALLVPVAALIRSLRRPQALPPHPIPRGLRVGLLGACVTLLVAYQASEATWLGFTWFVFGLAWTAGRPEA